MILSRAMMPLSAVIVGLGFAVSGMSVQAASWNLSIGGYSPGHHYSMGYRDYAHQQRSHARYRGVHDYGVPRYYVPVRYGYAGYGWQPTPTYVRYHAPVMVRGYTPARYANQVRYYDYRPAPRRSYDRVGAGEPYSGSDQAYPYDALDDEVTGFENIDAYEVSPTDVPARIERD